MASPIIKVEQGLIRGIFRTTESGKQFYSFRGIPYARPPIGDLRFKDPEPVKPWNGIFEAVSQGNRSIQFEEENLVGSEDCLYLNVHTPKLPSPENPDKYPVILHIHGGAFISGSGNEEELGPDYIVEKDIVFVNFNYRIGPLGFLNLGIVDAPGNAGLKDQVLALKWVQKNISVFGGDENNITLLGISAGAASVESHILSNCSKGLFHKTVIQSGSALCPWMFADSYNIYIERLLNNLNYKGNDDPESKCVFLKKIDPLELMNGTKKGLLLDSDIKNGILIPFFPTISKIPNFDNFLSAKPSEIFKSGQYAKVPTICGNIEKEGLIYSAYYSDSLVHHLKSGDYANCLPDWIKNDRSEMINMARRVYGNADNVNVADFFGDVIFAGAVEKSLEYKLKNGQDCYHYLFAYDGGINFMKRTFDIKEKGACHADDCTFLGPNANISESLYLIPHDKIVMKNYIQMWTDFSRFGNPTPESRKGSFIWKPATKDQHNILIIGTEMSMKIDDKNKERTLFWLKALENV